MINHDTIFNNTYKGEITINLGSFIIQQKRKGTCEHTNLDI